MEEKRNNSIDNLKATLVFLIVLQKVKIVTKSK